MPRPEQLEEVGDKPVEGVLPRVVLRAEDDRLAVVRERRAREDGALRCAGGFGNGGLLALGRVLVPRATCVPP